MKSHERVIVDSFSQGLQGKTGRSRALSWTIQGKGEGKRGKRRRRKRIGRGKEDLGAGEGRGGRGKGKKPCAFRHALLKTKGRRPPCWGPTAGLFWKTSRDSVYFCPLTTQQKQRCDLSLAQRELCAPGSTVPAPTPRPNSRREPGQQVAPSV